MCEYHKGASDHYVENESRAPDSHGADRTEWGRDFVRVVLTVKAALDVARL